MPYSPNDTLVPPLAAPARFGECCFRCLTLRGMSTSALRLLCRTRRRVRRRVGGDRGGRRTFLCCGGGPTGCGRGRSGTRRTGAARTSGTVSTVATRCALGGRGGVTRLLGLEPTDDLALVDPHLHADATERRLGLEEAVVDVGAQRVQRDTAVVVVLRAGHLGTAETTTALHADALDLRRAHRRLKRLTHRAPEGNTVGQLLRDTLGDELGVGLGVLDLENVQLNLLLGQLLQ